MDTALPVKAALFRAMATLGLGAFTKQDYDRAVILTPVEGARATAGVVFAVNGSPPRALFAIVGMGPNARIVDLSGTRGRILRRPQDHGPKLCAYEVLIAAYRVYATQLPATNLP